MEIDSQQPLLDPEPGNAPWAHSATWHKHLWGDVDEPHAQDRRDHSDSDSSFPRFVRLAVWLLFIFCGYVVARLGCYVGLPEDGVTDADAYDTFDDISKMLQFGFVLGWFLHVMDAERFVYLFARSGWYFIPTFLGTPPVYSLISNIPAFQHSLADISSWGPGMWALEIVAMSAAATTISWHARTVWRTKSRSDFAAYIGSRGAILGFYVAAGLLLSASSSHYSALHVHHLYIGWGIALFAEFDHPISVVTLALGLGVFVQGIGAFSFASNWQDPDCFSTKPMQQLMCSFNADAPFSINVCPGEGGAVPDHHCSGHA